MRYPSQQLRQASFLVLLALTPALQAEKLVLARSTVASEYLQKRMVDGKRQPQSYVFMTGRFLAGTTHDNSLAKTSFRTIAERLALDLRQQDFFPAKALTNADLLLVVHWGVTIGRNRDSVALSMASENLATIALEADDARRDLADAISRMDLDAAEQARGTLENLGNAQRSEYQGMLKNEPSVGEDSAALLGFSAQLRKESETLFDYERQKTLFALTKEECYFVIVMAYDAPTLIRDKKLKRVWTLRTSMSSAGVNFPEALDRIGNIAGRYFGTRQENVTFDYPVERKRGERVELGELVVIGQAKP